MNKGLAIKEDKALSLDRPPLMKYCNYKACLDLFVRVYNTLLDDIPYK